uniref:Uncharacterized protein n=1 Tax=Avena sativa TaxID=4498 RepID=A0ACD6A973_AVESA
MLESAIPTLWSTVHGWFTPAVLFVVLNIVIGTIAVSSKVTSAAGSGEGAAAGVGDGGEKRGLSRVPSMALDRLRSFKLSRHAAPFPEPPVAGVVDLGSDEYLPPLEKEEEVAVPDQEHPPHMERSRSEAAVEAELPRLPARLRKSASDKSAFAHFVAEEEEAEAVEERRPATTRDGARPRRPLAVAEPEEPVSEEEPEEAGGEVDARADDFINKFRHQLKLQRIDSFMRYRDTLRRGQATTAQQ